MGPEQLSDLELRERLKAIASAEREVTADLLRHLIELDRRRLCEDWGYPSLFVYCLKELGPSEAASCKRITAARAARAQPEILDLIAGGRLSLEVVLILHPHLNEDTAGYLLAKAQGMTARQAEVLVSQIAPRPDVRDFVMRLPDSPGTQEQPDPGAGATAPVRTPPSHPVIRSRDHVSPLTPSRFHIGFTAGAALWRKLEKAKLLLLHKHPKGRLEEIVDEMAEAFLEAWDPDRRKAGPGRRAAKPLNPESRTVPQSVRDAVWARDEGRCSYESRDGRRCDAEGMLEYDHIIPWALGGRSDDASNIRLLCRAHNQHAARRLFGDGIGDARRRKARPQ